MPTLLITYDLNSPGQNYEDLIEAIKATGSWAKIAKSTWAIRTHESAPAAFDRLRAHMDKGDTLHVVDITGRTAKWDGVSPEVTQWLQQNFL